MAIAGVGWEVDTGAQIHRAPEVNARRRLAAEVSWLQAQELVQRIGASRRLERDAATEAFLLRRQDQVPPIVRCYAWPELVNRGDDALLVAAIFAAILFVPVLTQERHPRAEDELRSGEIHLARRLAVHAEAQETLDTQVHTPAQIRFPDDPCELGCRAGGLLVDKAEDPLAGLIRDERSRR